MESQRFHVSSHSPENQHTVPPLLARHGGQCTRGQSGRKIEIAWRYGRLHNAAWIRHRHPGVRFVSRTLPREHKSGQSTVRSGLAIQYFPIGQPKALDTTSRRNYCSRTWVPRWLPLRREEKNGSSGYGYSDRDGCRRAGTMMEFNERFVLLRPVVAIAIALVLCLVCHAHSDERDDCLFSDAPSGTFEPTNCQNDPLGLMTTSVVKGIVELMGLPLIELSMRGCENARFKVSRIPSGRYVVIYPLRSDAQRDGYLGPIAHELAHVDQLKEFGTVGALRAALRSSDRVELEADFVAGLFLARLASPEERTRFARNPSVLGSYESTIFDWHGDPVERQSAFRMGFHLKEPPREIRLVRDLFQRDIYGMIKSLNAPPSPRR